MPNQYSRDKSAIIVVGPSIAYIPLSRGLYALVDIEDAIMLSNWNWSVTSSGGRKFYAENTKKQENGAWKHGKMHRYLICAACVDHKNGNGLDNRRSNLRAVTKAQNAWNSSYHRDGRIKMKGVHKAAKSWGFRVMANGKEYSKYGFSTKELAFAARCEKALEVHGEYAK